MRQNRCLRLSSLMISSCHYLLFACSVENNVTLPRQSIQLFLHGIQYESVSPLCSTLYYQPKIQHLSFLLVSRLGYSHWVCPGSIAFMASIMSISCFSCSFPLGPARYWAFIGRFTFSCSLNRCRTYFIKPMLLSWMGSNHVNIIICIFLNIGTALSIFQGVFFSTFSNFSSKCPLRWIDQPSHRGVPALHDI